MLSIAKIYDQFEGNYVPIPENVYWVESYSEAEVINFTKLIIFYIAYSYEEDISPALDAKAKLWHELSANLAKEIGITKEIDAIQAIFLKYPKAIPERMLDKYAGALITLRTKIWRTKTIKDKLFLRSAMPNTIKTLLNYAFSTINGSASAVANLSKSVVILKEPLLSAFFVTQVDNSNIKEIVKPYLQFIKNFTGRAQDGLDVDELDELKNKSESLRLKYSELSKAVTGLLNANMSNYIKSTGEHLVSADDIRDHLKELGIPYKQKIPEGFDGKYDAKFNMYLNDGRQIPTQIGGWMEMVKNPKPGSYVARGKGSMVREAKTYVPIKDTAKSTNEKFDKVAALLPNLANYVIRWRKDFMEGTGEQKTLGAMAELMFITAGRIGSYKRAEESLPVYGISVLKGKHIKVAGQNLIIEYEGKGFHKAKGTNTKIKHVLKPTNNVLQNLITYLEDQKAKVGNNGYIFQYKGQPIKESGLSKYLKNQVSFPLSPHKFRHLRGSKMFNDYLELNPIKKNATLKEVTDKVKEILVEIGNKLGHLRTNKEGKTEATFATAAKSYVDPNLMKKVFTDRDLPIPTFIPKNDANDEDD
jgi:hypothetical protein